MGVPGWLRTRLLSVRRSAPAHVELAASAATAIQELNVSRSGAAAGPVRR